MSKSDETKPRLIDYGDIIAMVVMVVVILFYFSSIIWTNKYIYGELDIRRHFYLFRKVAFDLMRNGELPLWIPHLYCGMPLLAASQVTPFYPPDLAFMVAKVPLNMAFNWDLLIHLIAAQVFSFLFFKRLFGRRTPAVFGSLWFWNLFFLGSIIIGDALNIRAMLLVPVVFYFVEASLGTGGRPVNLLFGSLALTLQILGGGLQFAFYTMAAVTAYAAFLLMTRARQKEDVLRPLLGFCALIIVALAIAAVQLLPQWEYSRLSVRTTGIPWFRIWAIEPHQLLDYIIPMFQGGGKGHGYFGIGTLALAVYSILYWKDSRKYFFLGLAAISIIYSLGGNTPISSYIAGLPLVRGFRGPFRGAILFNLSAFVLAGGTLVSFSRSNGSAASKRRRIPFAAISMVLVGGFIAAALFASRYSEASMAGTVSSAIFLGLSIAAAAVFIFSARLRAFASFALVGLLAADLAIHYRHSYSPTEVAELFGKDWTVPILEKDLNSSRVAVYNTADSNYFGLFGIESANGHHPFPTARYASFLPALENPKLASLAGVKYDVFYAFEKQGRPHNPPVKGHDDVFIKDSPLTALPRVFLVGKYSIVPSSRVLDAVQEPEFDPRKEVILEEEPTGLGGPASLSSEDSATIIGRSANEVSIETNSGEGAILVLCDSFYPGWQAQIDGKRAKVLTADYVYRAVPVPKGKHSVVFRFRPGSFLLGAALSCGGIIGWLLWGFFLWKRSRHPATRRLAKPH